MKRPFDLVGLGANALDHLVRVASHPQPDAPARIQEEVQCGGGQVATALATGARLGLRARYLGKVGDDTAGPQSLASLARHGVDVGAVVAVPGARSQTAFILVSDDGDRTICWQRDKTLGFSAADFSDGALCEGAILHLDTYEIDRNILAAQEARAAGVRILLDAEAMRPRFDELLQVCDIVIADAAFALRLTGESEPPAQLAAMRHYTSASVVAITLGTQGSVAWSEGETVAAPAYSVDVKDTTGAGDVFHGAFSYAVLRGWPLDLVCRFANAVAALSCRGLGGQSTLPRLREVQTLMGEMVDEAWEVPRHALPPDGLVDDAWDFAREAHRGQFRDEGTPYFDHPCRVARRLVEDFGVQDPEWVATALLHDTLEDVPLHHDYFRQRFGTRVFERVWTLTKDPRVPKPERLERYRAALAHASPEVLTVKVADRVDNLSRLHLSPNPGKAERYLRETRLEYLPLAERANPGATDLLREALDAATRLCGQVPSSAFKAV